MEVEEFLDSVYPVVDRESTLRGESRTEEVGDVNLVAVTGNEFMEAEDFSKHLHPIGESENNVIFNADDEILASKTDDGELVSDINNELMEVDDFLKDVQPVGDSKEKLITTPSVDIHKNEIGNVELVTCTNDVLMKVEDFFDDVHPAHDNDQNGHWEERDAVVEKTSAQEDAEKCDDKYNGQPEGIVPFSAIESNDTHVNQSENCGEYSKSVEEPINRESSGPSGSASTSSKPDFSKLKGKICLDSLSVRELQETFRATFGRETSVKDKQWLKRRISMALSNTCHVLSMTFVIDQSNTVKIVADESARVIEDTLPENLLIGESKEKLGGLPVCIRNQSEDPENVSGERLKNPSEGHDCCSEDQPTLGTGAKRARKPTKRYIEELSETESKEINTNLVSASQNFGHSHSVSKPRVRPECDTRSVRKPLVTRRDSLGGSGVRVPYVCRIRRSRPRENYVAFMNFQPGCMDVTTKPVKEALGSCDPVDDYGENKVFSAGSDPAWIQKHTMDEPEKERQGQEREICEPDKDEENVEPIQEDPPIENSDKETPDVEITKVGVKRKHHRPWSLTEVVNLVDGVARFGAGKWSEIKRLSFSSHSYRTSVDLKDKWRNLMRASFAQPAAEQGIPRKQVSTPIPPQILGRVRDLAMMQAQVPPVLNSSKYNGENVHVTSPGYL